MVVSGPGFVRADGGVLVDGAGEAWIPRGIGLGNWLLPEGYMWKFGDLSPREIEALTVRLLGSGRAEAFWRGFLDVFISEADIAMISALGFDHVRLPVNARHVQDTHGRPIEAGYAVIDRVIGWCRKYGLLVLLDLHGAPGGQTGTNIDDSPHRRPEVFSVPRYWELTLWLWRDFALRYGHDPMIMGYDLLNEPLPNQWRIKHRRDLVRLYRELTMVIREVDQDHLIMYEGMHWGTDFSLFNAVWDENSALQFHKYWSPPDRASLANFLRARDRLGLPLYLGESGENTPAWLDTTFRLVESEQIGWNFWPWKKINTDTSPFSVVPPPGWDKVIAAAANKDDHGLDRSEALEIFDQLVINMSLARCEMRSEIITGVLGRRPLP